MENGVEEHLGEKIAPRKITVKMLKAYAKENKIDLQGKTRKQTIWGIIRAGVKVEAIDLPDIQDINNTNLLNFREKELIVFESEDCSAWLPTILKTGTIGSGVEGDIYDYGDKVMKVEYTGEGTNYIYSIVFMRKLNQFIEHNKVLNFAKTFMVYVCTDRLVTFMQRIDGPELEEVKPMQFRKGRVNTQELISIFLQILMVFVVFFYNGMNHFDLHNRNILLEKTPYKVLEYSFGGESIRIPTFGRVAKVIDFGDVGLLLNNGDIKLSEPERTTGIADKRKRPHSFYEAGFGFMCSGFPFLENQEELCKGWKQSNQELFVITMKNENVLERFKRYKVATAFNLFTRAQRFYRFSTSGKTFKITIA